MKGQWVRPGNRLSWLEPDAVGLVEMGTRKTRAS